MTTFGVTKAVSAGSAVIKANVAGKTLKCRITVNNADANAENLTFANPTGGDFVKDCSTAEVSFRLDATSTAVDVSVLNGENKIVYTKTYDKCTANKIYSFNWNGKNSGGQYVPTGQYFVKVTAGSLMTDSDLIKFYNVADFAGGDGSSDNPYQVSTLAQLNNIRKYNGRCFIQTADIDGNDGNFVPLFASNDYFTGIYDGDSHTKIS